ACHLTCHRGCVLTYPMASASIRSRLPPWAMTQAAGRQIGKSWSATSNTSHRGERSDDGWHGLDDGGNGAALAADHRCAGLVDCRTDQVPVLEMRPTIIRGERS